MPNGSWIILTSSTTSHSSTCSKEKCRRAISCSIPSLLLNSHRKSIITKASSSWKVLMIKIPPSTQQKKHKKLNRYWWISIKPLLPSLPSSISSSLISTFSSSSCLKRKIITEHSTKWIASKNWCPSSHRETSRMINALAFPAFPAYTRMMTSLKRKQAAINLACGRGIATIICCSI